MLGMMIVECRPYMILIIHGLCNINGGYLISIGLFKINWAI